MRLNVLYVTILGSCLSACSYMPFGVPDSGRLLATGGVTQVEGSAGSGLSTWSVIPGYGTDNSIGGSAFLTQTTLDDFSFRAKGAAVGINNKVEISYARQDFDTGDTGPVLGLRRGYTFKQDVIGVKVKVAGDVVYDQDRLMPQISVGMQYKKNQDEALVKALGASDDDGIDVYVSGTKLFLDKNLIVSATLRGTKANQLGLLGFGGDRNDDYKAEFEGSAALMLAKNFVVGADYRTKPDNLGFATENDAKAAYIAYFPSKHASLTLAGVDMGHIANQGRQRGLYVSAQVGF